VGGLKLLSSGAGVEEVSGSSVNPSFGSVKGLVGEGVNLGCCKIPPVTGHVGVFVQSGG
jgi:hypothetical protein